MGIGCHYGVNKKSQDMVRGNIKASVPSSKEISYVHCCDPFFEKMEKMCEWLEDQTEKWLSVVL
jgi:hypothetical protein